MDLMLPFTLDQALKLIWDLLEEIQQLREENQKLKDKIEELLLQINKNSSNSSKPPSTDIKGNTAGKGKQGGAKKGRVGAFRLPFTDEQITKKVKIFPNTCPRCGSTNLASERKSILAITTSCIRRRAEELLGKNSHQPTITDRYPAYRFQGPHQYCLAHWKRNRPLA